MKFASETRWMSLLTSLSREWCHMMEASACRVIAACRNPSSAEELNSLAKEHEGRLSTVQMDITDEDSIQVH